MMTSRERVLSSIAHKEPDRVPIDLGATPSSGISAIAYGRLTSSLQLTNSKTKVYDVVQQLAQPELEVLDRFGVDVLDIGRTFNTEDSDWQDIVLSDGSPAKYPAGFQMKMEPNGIKAYDKSGDIVGHMPQGATFFDQTIFPYREAYPDSLKDLPKAMEKVIWSALVHSPWDHAGEAHFWEDLRKKALALRQNSDRALMIVCGCNLFEWGTFLRGIDNFLMDLYLEEDNVERLLDALLDCHLKTLEKVCESVGDVVDILRFGDDLGMDSGPFMSPELYRKFFKPRHFQLCDYVKKHSKMHTFLHSCGSLYKLMPDLIEAGYDIINPVQTNCKDMEPEKLKKEFGKDITFWGGGSNTRELLNRGTPQQVAEDVKRRLEVFAPGGGYVFNPIHNILPDVPAQNIIAMFQAVEDFYK